MQTVTSWISSLVSDAGSRLDYSINHMNLTQWGIVATISVSLGFLGMRSHRLN
ncbi:MAG: hypothetical protein SGI77_21865 [Pirellulaceae bacterium]|nr:hypothetical protein [Pirellulaceae bacterium]